MTAAATRARLRLEVRSTLGDLEGPWDDLVADSARPSPFLRSWWLEGVHGQRPRFVVVFDDDELIGGIALDEDRRPGVPRLRFIGAAFAADHVDALAKGGRADDVRQSLNGWLSRNGSRIVELDGLDDDALALAVVGPDAKVEHSDVAPWAALPATFDEYWQARPSKLRSTVRRTSQRLERDGVRYERLAVDQADRAMSDFVALHRGRWQAESALEPLLARFDVAARAGLSRGELVAHRLVRGDEAIAVELWFEVCGIASFYQSGRSIDHRWRGAGSVLKARVVEDTCTRGMHEIDLLRGDEPYKRDWTDQRRDLLSLSTAKGITAHAARAAFEIARAPRRRRARLADAD